MQKEDHCFVQDYEYFKSIAKSQRPDFNRKLLEIPQKKGEYKIYSMEYPTSGIWQYKDYQLFYSCFKYDQSKAPKALLFSFHGLNDHSGSSGYFCMNIAKKLQLDVYALDFKNFGRSKGPFRGEIQSFEDMVNQAESFIEFIKQKYSQKDKIKIYIEGLSLGGAVCFKLSIRNPQRYAGAIMLSPALAENAQSQPYLKKLGKLMGKFFPRTKIISQTYDSQSKVDQTDRILKDPFVYTDKVVPVSVKVLLESMQQIYKEYNQFDRPFILIQSGVDKLVDPFAALDLEENCSSKDKTVIYCKNMWHDIHSEDEIEDLIPIVINWMSKRI